MKVVIHLPPDYRHTRFHLVVEKRLEPGELEPNDLMALEKTLLATKRIAKRLAKVDEQTPNT